MRILGIVAASAVLFLGLAVLADTPATQPTTQEAPNVPPVLNFTMKSLLTGKDVNLSQYMGKVVLIVNVASKCGNTPQYAPLEAMNVKYGPQGLAILGFPCNQFKHQEPGTDAEIAAFCSATYGVKFDMFSKIDVNGPTQCPLYKFLTSADTDKPFAGPITWNFEKFLVSRKGEVVARFTPKTKPDSDAVTKAVEAELAK